MQTGRVIQYAASRIKMQGNENLERCWQSLASLRCRLQTFLNEIYDEHCPLPPESILFEHFNVIIHIKWVAAISEYTLSAHGSLSQHIY